MGLNSSKIIKLPLIVFILYIFWGFIFSQTILSNNLMVYTSFVFLFVSFGYLALSSGIKTDSLTIVWFPYLLLTSFAYFSKGDIEHFCYWFVCICFLMLSKRKKIVENVPYKLLLYSGIFAMIGVFFELLLPDIYFNSITPLFISNDQIASWNEGEYGLAGFTYQLDTTAIPILYSEGVFITLFSDRITSKYKFGKFYYYAILLLMIIGVFLTGKRLLSLISVVLPFVLFVLKQSRITKSFFIIILILFVGYFGYLYFIENAESFVDNIFLRRMARSVIESKMGVDVSSSRTYLYDLAWKSYHSSPLFGIGVGEFMNKTGAYTAVHNAYLQVLCEQGIIGFLLFIFPLVKCLLTTIRLLRSRASMIDDGFALLLFSLFVQLVFILYGLTGNPTINTFGYMMYFLSIAILVHIKDYNYEKGFTHNL